MKNKRSMLCSGGARPIFQLSCCVILLAGCSGEKAKEAASGVTKKTVELAKGTVSGIDEGIDSGRKAADSIDGATIISTPAEFEQALTVEILTVSRGTGIGVENAIVEFGLVNGSDTPVRVVGFSVPGTVLVLDVDNYACQPTGIAPVVTVPANAKQKVRLEFACKSDKVGKLRLFGHDFDVPRERIIDNRPAPAEKAPAE